VTNCIGDFGNVSVIAQARPGECHFGDVKFGIAQASAKLAQETPGPLAEE
jgi:hypothetical protein